MTPFQSAKSKQLHKFLHHVRSIRSEIQKISSRVARIEMAGPSLDRWTQDGNQKTP